MINVHTSATVCKGVVVIILQECVSVKMDGKEGGVKKVSDVFVM